MLEVCLIASVDPISRRLCLIELESGGRAPMGQPLRYHCFWQQLLPIMKLYKTPIVFIFLTEWYDYFRLILDYIRAIAKVIILNFQNCRCKKLRRKKKEGGSCSYFVTYFKNIVFFFHFISRVAYTVFQSSCKHHTVKHVRG